MSLSNKVEVRDGTGKVVNTVKIAAFFLAVLLLGGAAVSLFKVTIKVSANNTALTGVHRAP